MRSSFMQDAFSVFVNSFEIRSRERAPHTLKSTSAFADRAKVSDASRIRSPVECCPYLATARNDRDGELPSGSSLLSYSQVARVYVYSVMLVCSSMCSCERLNLMWQESETCTSYQVFSSV